MPYADPDRQREAAALWYWVQYHQPGKLGREFRRRESERKKRHWKETMTEAEKERRRRKARIAMRRLRASRKQADEAARK